MDKVYIIELFPNSGIFLELALGEHCLVNSAMEAQRFATRISAERYIKEHLKNFPSAKVRVLVLSFAVGSE